MSGALTQSRMIGFSDNWNNKLDAKRYFSTIRISNPNKFYKGNVLEIKYKDKTFQAQVEEVVTKKIAEFSEIELALDTGYTKEESLNIFRKFFPELNFETANFDYVLLKRIEQSELKEQELIFAKTLDALKHPAPEKKEFQLKLIREISESGKAAFLDTETTGFDGEVIELGILSLDGKVLFNELIRPVKWYIHPGALSTHGISLSDLSEKQNLHHYKYQLKRIFEDYLIIIYNAEFDMKILQNSFKLQDHLDESMGMIDLNAVKTFCLMNSYAVIEGTEGSKSYTYDGFKTWKLSEACRKEGIDVSGIKAHRALADCEMTRQLFMKLEEKQ